MNPPRPIAVQGSGRSARVLMKDQSGKYLLFAGAIDRGRIIHKIEVIAPDAASKLYQAAETKLENFQ